MSEVPEWLDDLVNVVADAMEAHAPGPMGLRYREDDGTWDVLVYPLPVELVGGAYDGGVLTPDFSLDIERVRSAFTRLDDVNWQAHRLGDEEDAPCVSFEGEYDDRDVWLRVLAFAPPDEEPGAKFDLSRE